MATQYIGYDNVLEDATLTVTSEATGYEGANIADWLTYDWWKPASTGVHYITAVLDSARTVDYFAVYGHDLAETGSTIMLQYSPNSGGMWNSLTVPLSSSKGRVIFKKFTAVSSTHYRVVLSCPTSIASVAVVSFGEALELPKSAPLNFTPPTHSFKDSFLTSKSDGNRLLGQTRMRREAEITIMCDLVDPSWVRSYWIPFVDRDRLVFFYSWNYENFPDEAAFCYMNGEVDAIPYQSGIWSNIKLKVKALLTV